MATIDNPWIRLSRLTDKELAPLDNAVHDLARKLAPELGDGDRGQAAWSAIDAAHRTLVDGLAESWRERDA